MAIFLATRTFQVSLHLQYRALFISSLANKGQEYSRPVRYVPKNETNVKNLQKPPSLQCNQKKQGVSPKLPEKVEEQSRIGPLDVEMAKSREMYEQTGESLELEDANSSAVEFVDAVERVSNFVLDKASNSLDNKITGALNSKTKQDAQKLAIELLAARAFTEIELQKKLRAKKFPSSIVESVITDIKCRGLLNDGFYAESFSRSRWLSSTWGPRRIKQALLMKGVSEMEAEKAMKQVFEGDDIGSDGQNMNHGMSKLSMDRLFLQASKQWLRGQGTSLENRKSRIIRWLQYRGFNWGVTSFILKKLEAQYPHETRS